MEKYNEEQAFEIELRKELDKFFPKEFIPDNFHLASKRALQHQSLPSLKIGIATYEKIMLFINGTIDSITFYEISFLINAIGSATPKQLIKPKRQMFRLFLRLFLRKRYVPDVTIDYVTIQKDIINLSNKWNSIVQPIKESTRRKVKAHIIRGINPVSNGKH